MATNETSNTVNSKRIVVTNNGPYSVEVDVPLVIKTQVVSEQKDNRITKTAG